LAYLKAAYEQASRRETVPEDLPNYLLWNAALIDKKVTWSQHENYMQEDEELWKVLEGLDRTGLAFLKGVPTNETAIEQVVGRIGKLRDTFYGLTWNVRSEPNAKNVAYTPDYLGLHMDLLYMTNPPHLQFLHSLRAQCPGGTSFFSDSVYAAEILRREAPELFVSLATFPVTYHYANDGQYYRYTRPTIELYPTANNGGTINAPIKCVNWSPPFQGPFADHIAHRIDGSTPSESAIELQTYHKAAKAFDWLLNAPENVWRYRLEEGDLVIFDNRRALHARDEFDARAGERWLKGAYLDDDVYRSKLRTLRQRFAQGESFDVARGFESYIQRPEV